MILYGQNNKTHTWSFQGNYDIMESSDDVYGSDIYSASVIYEYQLRPKLAIGGGFGLGTSNAMVYDYKIGVIEEDDLRDKTQIIKIFGRVKYKFSDTPSGFFINCDLGYVNGSVEGWDGSNNNPFGINIVPSVGATLSLNSNYSVFFGAGLSLQRIKYGKVDTYPSDVPWQLLDYDVTMASKQTSGFQLYAGISF